MVSNYLRSFDMKGSMWGSGTVFSDMDNIWGNSTTADRATVGVDAHFGSEITWDYYLDVFNRKGVFNDSKGTLSRVHYGNKYNNAFWSSFCKCMTYGDGAGTLFTPLVSLDVVGHEMMHGVTDSVAGLIYNKQSGGLNEGISDIYANV